MCDIMNSVLIFKCRYYIIFLPFIFLFVSAQSMNESILKSVPWPIKLLLLKDVDPDAIAKEQMLEEMKGFTRPLTAESKHVVTYPEELKPLSNNLPYRRVGVEALVQRRDGGDATSLAFNEEETNMRLKLFRLMYETVRDSDMKVRRADLIKTHYINSTGWELGFFMGEVQEKFDIVNEFASTLDKFYTVWKPIEHINAYEQIANYAIQINHLIDLIVSIGKNRA